MFRLTEMLCHTTVLLTQDGLQHMIVRSGSRSLQFVVNGSSLLKPARLVWDAVLDPKIASYLRHKSPDMTMHYAKVDFAFLLDAILHHAFNGVACSRSR